MINLLPTTADKNRLRWRSRRGLLELDLILERFLANDFESLNASDMLAYHDLLMLSDYELLSVITDKTPNEIRINPQNIALLGRLRRWCAP